MLNCWDGTVCPPNRFLARTLTHNFFSDQPAGSRDARTPAGRSAHNLSLIIQKGPLGPIYTNETQQCCAFTINYVLSI